ALCGVARRSVQGHRRAGTRSGPVPCGWRRASIGRSPATPAGAAKLRREHDRAARVSRCAGSPPPRYVRGADYTDQQGPREPRAPARGNAAPAARQLMITGPMIAEIAALVGDPARATMVSSLLDGRALTASELALAAHITPQTASTHLAKLTAAGLLSVVRHGRHRSFRLALPTVGDMIDGIVAVALLKRPRYRPLSRDARALSVARICYDHLAGRLSVNLTDAFVAREYVVLHDKAAEITTAGTRVFTEF